MRPKIARSTCESADRRVRIGTAVGAQRGHYQVRVFRKAINRIIELLRMTMKVLIDDSSWALLVLSSSAAAAEEAELSGDFMVSTFGRIARILFILFHIYFTTQCLKYVFNIAIKRKLLCIQFNKLFD